MKAERAVNNSQANHPMRAGSNSNHHIVGYEIGKIKVPAIRGYPFVDIETPGSAGSGVRAFTATA